MSFTRILSRKTACLAALYFVFFALSCYGSGEADK